MPTGPRVKGIALLTDVAALTALRGAEQTARVVQALDGEVGAAMRAQTVLPGNWYPLAWYAQFLTVMASETRGGVPLLREVGRKSVELDLNSTYRFFMRLLSPDRVFGFSTNFFSNYFDTGKASIMESRAKYVRCAWRGCAGFDENLWTVTLAGAEAILLITGTRNLRLHCSDGGGRNTFMEAEAFWT